MGPRTRGELIVICAPLIFSLLRVESESLEFLSETDTETATFRASVVGVS
ncbi:hypothetical protein Fmac_009729 [Flemingia macrophylla]|uniref:Uncharacterized protein n=1 Tax=Flemingia macrophylla TaxID=520843 RepID=A0ABD1N164_9FABA